MSKEIELVSDVQGEEMMFLRNSANWYRKRSKDHQMILPFRLLGFVGFSGVHRFVPNQFNLVGLVFFASVLCLMSSSVFGQQNLDSLIKVRQAEQEIELKKIDSLLAIERSIRISQLFSADTDTVESIRFNRYKIDEIPDLSQFKKAQTIDFRNNQLEIIKRGIWPKTDSLKRIILGNNELRKVRFKKSKSVTHVDLSENNLERIPWSLRKFKNLRSLNVSKNEIERLPCFIRRMDSLQELVINYNQLKELSKRDIRKLRHIKIIHIGANQISSIPENIDELTKVETLNFGINQISDIPASFSNLKTLEHVIFYKNSFDAIPEEIWELKNLKEIDFYHNQIQEIPQAIGSMDSLVQIFLAYNKIEIIPDTLFTLKKLKALYLHHNEIVMVPQKITQLDQLIYLDLGFNRIFEIPDLSQLKKLVEIDLQENTLSEFPYELIEIESLQTIYLMGNPFVMTKKEKAEMQKLSEELNELGIRLFF